VLLADAEDTLVFMYVELLSGTYPVLRAVNVDTDAEFALYPDSWPIVEYTVLARALYVVPEFKELNVIFLVRVTSSFVSAELPCVSQYSQTPPDSTNRSNSMYAILALRL
jgi:hypothetical protein